MTTFRFFLAFVLPSVAIGLLEGATWRFWLTSLLTLLGLFPGVIYALVLLYRDEASPFPSLSSTLPQSD
jgi:uncharacterized membrane protein YqaE (UPF0057 family)